MSLPNQSQLKLSIDDYQDEESVVDNIPAILEVQIEHQSTSTLISLDNLPDSIENVCRNDNDNDVENHLEHSLQNPQGRVESDNNIIFEADGEAPLNEAPPTYEEVIEYDSSVMLINNYRTL